MEIKAASHVNGASYAVEWSHSQRQFHIDTVERILEKNLRQYFDNRGPDYIPLCFFDTSKDAHAFVDQLEAAKKGA